MRNEKWGEEWRLTGKDDGPDKDTAGGGCATNDAPRFVEWAMGPCIQTPGLPERIHAPSATSAQGAAASVSRVTTSRDCNSGPLSRKTIVPLISCEPATKASGVMR